MRTTKATVEQTFGQNGAVNAPKCDRVNKMIVVASGKGGVGKSTLSANLGIALGAMNQQVCLFDADTNLANINILFGLKPEHTLQDCLAGEKSLEQILVPVSDHLQIVPAASGIAEFIELAPDQQKRLISGLKGIEQHHDQILVDCAAGIGNSQLSFFLAASCAILVITPEPTSLTDAFSFLKMAKRYGFKRTVHILVNMASDLHTARSAFKRFKHATEQYLQLDVGYLGYVLRDPHVPESVRKQQPVMQFKPDCLASRCIRAITERLVRLLQHDQGSHTPFSHYLVEMNQPFGIEVTTEETERSVDEKKLSPDAWQQQSLNYLQQMDQGAAAQFIQRAMSEWASQHNADESELLSDDRYAGIELVAAEPSVHPDSQNSNVTDFVRQNNPVESTASSSRLSFEGVVAQSDYCAAIQFAELLARGGKP
ncbi:MAG: MinD/ParA family protein [Sedimenticola sp.]|nr:MinD/ParA family protein [Sedimenticola sp.]